MKLAVTICCLLAGVTVISAYKSYAGYQVIQVVPRTPSQLNMLVNLEKLSKMNLVDFWKEPSKLNRPVDIMGHRVPLMRLRRKFAMRGMFAKTVVSDVQKLIQKDVEHMLSVKPHTKGASPKDFTLNEYHSYDDISNYLDNVASTYPSIASTFTIGKTFNGQTLKAIKIGVAGSNKKGYWLDAGIHAREWIAPAAALYIIDQLVSNQNDPKIANYLSKIDFYIAPVLNPDGYAYTMSDDRMWRKTRSGPYSSGGWWSSSCYGVDPNRNWDSKWDVAGTSTNPCDETYGGPKVFSEDDTSETAKWLHDNADKLQAYISFHSYSQLWLYSYGYAANTYPDNIAELRTVAQQGVAAVKAIHGTSYQIGSPTDILYAASGSSMDYASKLGIRFSYTLELRPTDSSSYGFQLPADQIIATGEETWAGLQVVADQLT